MKIVGYILLTIIGGIVMFTLLSACLYILIGIWADIGCRTIENQTELYCFDTYTLR